MPVATMFAIAAAFWSAHGYPASPNVNWAWDYGPPDHAGSAWVIRDGSDNRVVASGITLNRYGWDHASNRTRCIIAVHEMGHYEFDFVHKDGTVMAGDEKLWTNNVPGTCLRSARAWRTLTLPSR